MHQMTFFIWLDHFSASISNGRLYTQKHPEEPEESFVLLRMER